MPERGRRLSGTEPATFATETGRAVVGIAAGLAILVVVTVAALWSSRQPQDGEPPPAATSAPTTEAPVTTVPRDDEDSGLAAWPSPESTGVPAGATLEPSESLTVDVDGTVIAGLDVTGTITVAADNVTVRRTRVRGNPDGLLVTIAEDAHGTVLEDVRLAGGDRCAATIGFGRYTARRVHVTGCIDGMKIGVDTTVVDSYVTGQHRSEGGHHDAVQATGGARITLRHNRLEGFTSNGGRANAAVIIQSALAPVTEVTVVENLLSGGNYTVYLREGDHGPLSGVSLERNVFLRDTWQFGPLSARGVNAWTVEANLFADPPSDDG